MFGQGAEVWSLIREIGIDALNRESLVASISRADPNDTYSQRLCDSKFSPPANIAAFEAKARGFVKKFASELSNHGDSRLSNPGIVAEDFTRGVMRDLEAVLAKGRVSKEQFFCELGIAPELAESRATIGEIAEMYLYDLHLAQFSEKLRPHAKIDATIVPHDSLPSYFLSRKLRVSQETAERVSGSDLGDADHSTLINYATAVEVDKRTFEFLRQVARAEPRLLHCLKRVIRSTSYLQILDHPLLAE